MSASWRKLRWFLAYWISRTGAFLGRYVPAQFWYTLADPIADLCYVFMRRQRHVLQENLARVVGPEQAPAAARRVFRNFARYVIDFYQLPSLSKDALCNRIEFHDWRHLNEALQPGAGGIFVTMHLGQVELGAGALAAYGHSPNAIAETFDYPPMNEFIQGLRRDLGMNVIPANKAKMGVLRCLNRGETLCMMIDVIEAGDGVMVDFFGQQVEFSSAPARIAIRTRARVMPGVVARAPHDRMKLLPKIDFGLHYELSGDEETDVRALTQQIATSLESYVREFPDQWFAFRAAPQRVAANAGPQSKGDWRLWALKAGIQLSNVLPRPAAYAVARFAADLAYSQRHGARADVQDNMRHVMGPDAPQEAVDAAAREAFRNVARYYVDLIRVPRMNLQRMIGKQVRLHGFERLKSRLDSGRGVIVATAHFGNMELAVQVGALLGLPSLVLAEPLQPPAFADLMHRLRSAYNVHYEDVGYHAVAESLRHLRSGGLLAIACDRDIQHKGRQVEFFGVETRMPTGAAEIALRTGADLMPGYCRRAEDGGFDIYFEEPLELTTTGNASEDAVVNTRKLLQRAEAWISADPGQWMPLERIWPATVPAKPKRSKVAAK
jgi:phosphatidylinositol dimannoside acyltransferase